MGLIRFAIKSSIAGGIVYYTTQEGLWSSPEDAAKVYNKLYNTLTPIVQKNVPKEVINEVSQLPRPSDLKALAVSYWNQGVINSIKFLSNLSIHLNDGIIRIKQEIDKLDLSSSETVKPEESKKSN